MARRGTLHGDPPDSASTTHTTVAACTSKPTQCDRSPVGLFRCLLARPGSVLAPRWIERCRLVLIRPWWGRSRPRPQRHRVHPDPEALSSVIEHVDPASDPKEATSWPAELAVRPGPHRTQPVTRRRGGECLSECEGRARSARARDPSVARSRASSGHRRGLAQAASSPRRLCDHDNLRDGSRS